MWQAPIFEITNLCKTSENQYDKERFNPIPYGGAIWPPIGFLPKIRKLAGAEGPSIENPNMI